MSDDGYELRRYDDNVLLDGQPCAFDVAGALLLSVCWGPGEALVDSRPLFLYQRNPSLLWRCRRSAFGGRKACWVFFPNRGFPFLVWLARADKTASFGSGFYFVI
jgi:hypothetical protein